MALYAQQLSTDDVLMGEILISLKRHAVVQQREVTPSTSYRSKVDLTVQMPTRQETENAASFASLSTVSPVASSAYTLVVPSHSPSERTKRYGPVVQLDDLRKCFNMPIAAVARKFGICATLLKKICRRHGIQRWPHRQIRSLQKSIDMLRESLAVAKGSNKEYIAKKIAAFEYTLECIMQDPNTAAKGISAGRLASPATEELVKRGNRAKSRTQKLQLSSASALAAALSEDDDMDDMEDEDDALRRATVASPLAAAYVQHAEERNVGMSLKSILC
jgi:hypothetical protein|uniref:RWP-RK domain-containing protein n=1 Tax=Globisporangium ultimum (strain ATCC 200006 / CBS 805.95 / DAOM BR144) TaxID=431595 RepID=K3X7E0_GLOUD